MTLPFADLDHAARMIAAGDPFNFDDIYQDAWEKMIRYPPRSFGAALQFAKYARSEFWKRERKHRHDELDDAYAAPPLILQAEPAERKRMPSNVARVPHDDLPQRADIHKAWAA